jgi:Fur family peroxide stress response transcriptional regulator
MYKDYEEGQMAIEKRLRAFEEVCRREGLKITHQRFEIFVELLNSSDHPTVEKLYSRLKTKLPSISLDTIYRTLSTLEQHGLVTRVQTHESLARFEGRIDNHQHVICKKCGKITDFHWELLDAAALPDEIIKWGRIERKNITLHGLCQECG